MFFFLFVMESSKYFRTVGLKYCVTRKKPVSFVLDSLTTILRVPEMSQNGRRIYFTIIET